MAALAALRDPKGVCAAGNPRAIRPWLHPPVRLDRSRVPADDAAGAVQYEGFALDHLPDFLFFLKLKRRLNPEYPEEIGSSGFNRINFLV